MNLAIAIDISNYVCGFVIPIAATWFIVKVLKKINELEED